MKCQTLVPSSEGNAKICGWLGRNTGWGWDNPVSRVTWRGLNGLLEVYDCNSLCQAQGRSRGSCQGNLTTDQSTWRLGRQTCICYWPSVIQPNSNEHHRKFSQRRKPTLSQNRNQIHKYNPKRNQRSMDDQSLLGHDFGFDRSLVV